jgi:hypothetical protein
MTCRSVIAVEVLLHYIHIVRGHLVWLPGQLLDPFFSSSYQMGTGEVLLARSCRKSCSHSAVLEGGARKCSSHRILARREWIWPWVPLPSSCSRMGTERWRVADLRAGAGEHGARAWSDGARRSRRAWRGGMERRCAADWWARAGAGGARRTSHGSGGPVAHAYPRGPG